MKKEKIIITNPEEKYCDQCGEPCRLVPCNFDRYDTKTGKQKFEYTWCDNKDCEINEVKVCNHEYDKYFIFTSKFCKKCGFYNDPFYYDFI